MRTRMSGTHVPMIEALLKVDVFAQRLLVEADVFGFEYGDDGDRAKVDWTAAQAVVAQANVGDPGGASVFRAQTAKGTRWSVFVVDDGVGLREKVAWTGEPMELDVELRHGLLERYIVQAVTHMQGDGSSESVAHYPGGADLRRGGTLEPR